MRLNGFIYAVYEGFSLVWDYSTWGDMMMLFVIDLCDK